MTRGLLTSKRLVALLSLFAPAAAFGVYPDSGPDTTFTWVGTVNGASGVVIAPNWVITAQHVGGNSFTVNGTTYNADATYDAPTYDLHLMHFGNTFGGYYPLFNGDPLLQNVTLVGFGQTGTARADGTGFLNAGGGGTRRAATNRIGLLQNLDYNGWSTPCVIADLDAPAGNNLSAPYNRDWFGDGGATANEGGLLGGDSGGGWFINVAGQWQVVGVSNYIFYDDSVAPPGDPDPYLAYGISASSAANLTDAGVRDWVRTTVPEPASTAAIAAGIAGLLMRRRRPRK
jgi:hypothetical protein